MRVSPGASLMKFKVRKNSFRLSQTLMNGRRPGSGGGYALQTRKQSFQHRSFYRPMEGALQQEEPIKIYE